MSTARHWYLFPAACIALGLASFALSGASPWYRELFGVVWIAFGLVGLIDAEPVRHSVPHGLLPRTCPCPSCGERVKTGEALWLYRHGHPNHSKVSDSGRYVMRCPSCQAVFRQVDDDSRYLIMIPLLGLSALAVFLALWLSKLWIVLIPMVALSVTLRYLLRGLRYVVVGEGIAADTLQPLPDAQAPRSRSRLRLTKGIPAAMAVMLLARALLRDLGYKLPEWLSVGVLVAAVAGVSLLALLAAMVGWRATQRAAWPVLDPALYPLRPLETRDGRSARAIGLLYLGMGLTIAAGALAYAFSLVAAPPA